MMMSLAVDVRDYCPWLKYDPDQPRAPVGSEHGGERTSQGGGASSSRPPMKFQGEGYSIPVFQLDAAWKNSINDEWLKEEAERLGVTKNEYRQMIEVEMGRLLDGANVNMRLPAAAFDSVLKSGNFLTQHDVGKSKGHLDPELRSAFESKFFGSEPGEGPHYGFMSADGRGAVFTYDSAFEPNEVILSRDNVEQYGEVRVTFKDAVKSRTTWVEADSLDANRDVVYSKPGGPTYPINSVPSSVRKPDYRSTIRPKLETVKKAQRIEELAHSYIEAQVHGKLSVADIAHVTFSKSSTMNRFSAKLKKLGITSSLVENSATLAKVPFDRVSE